MQLSYLSLRVFSLQRVSTHQPSKDGHQPLRVSHLQSPKVMGHQEPHVSCFGSLPGSSCRTSTIFNPRAYMEVLVFSFWASMVSRESKVSRNVQVCTPCVSLSRASRGSNLTIFKVSTLRALSLFASSLQCFYALTLQNLYYSVSSVSIHICFAFIIGSIITSLCNTKAPQQVWLPCPQPVHESHQGSQNGSWVPTWTVLWECLKIRVVK